MSLTTEKLFRLNNNAKEKLVEAFASGRFEQAELPVKNCKDGGLYCFGGVVFDTMLADLGEEVPELYTKLFAIGCMNKLADWLGVPKDRLNEFCVFTYRLHQNLTFSEIAEYIKREF